MEHSLTHGVGRNDGIGSSMLLPRWSLYEGAALSYKVRYMLVVCLQSRAAAPSSPPPRARSMTTAIDVI